MAKIKIKKIPGYMCGGKTKMEQGGDWIQEATQGMRKDHPCTGSKFGGPSCPPGSKRYNLAKTFRKMAKEQYGGSIDPMYKSVPGVGLSPVGPSYNFGSDYGKTNKLDSLSYLNEYNKAVKYGPVEYEKMFLTPAYSTALQASDQGNRNAAERWMNIFRMNSNVLDDVNRTGSNAATQPYTLYKPNDTVIPRKDNGGYIKDYSGLGTYLYNQPVEMQLQGMNPIVGGPMDVMATDQMGQQSFIPAGAQDPTMMYGNVKEVPMMRGGGQTPISMHNNSGVGYYNPHRDFHEIMSNSINPTYEDQITASVKPVERDEANIEAEKGEIKMKPGLMGLHKIGGKKHTEGGTPLFAEGGSFIFSNDKNLSINKQERELFDFKKFKSNAAKNNTPAKILEREVSPKEYNNMINILTDDKYDNISKQTAALMLEKMQKKIGQVAFIQEAKKTQPIPEFAMGSAPIVSDDISRQEQEQKMYQLGGGVGLQGLFDLIESKKKENNKQSNVNNLGIYLGGKTKKGRITPTGLTNEFNYDNGIFGGGSNQDNPNVGLLSDWRNVGVDLSKMNPGEAQSAMYDWALKNNPDILRNMWSTYGNTAQGKKLGVNFDASKMSQDDLVRAKKAYVDNMLGARTFTPEEKIKWPDPNLDVPFTPVPESPANPSSPSPAPVPGPSQPFSANPSLPYDIKGKLTPAQRAHLGYLGLQALSINKYYPKREQVVLPEVNLNTINDQPYVNQINNQAFQAYNATRAASPQSANLMASNIYGKGLDAISQTLGNIDNQNTQIKNQENLTNLQQRTNQILTNTQYDDRYYDQVQTTRQNYDDEKRFANNQFFGTLNQYQSQADQLAWALASVNKYGKRAVVDPKTGRTYDQPVPLYEVTNNGIKYNSDVANLNLASGADRLNSATEAKALLEQFGINPNDPKAVYSISRLLDAMSGRGKQPIYSQNPYLLQ